MPKKNELCRLPAVCGRTAELFSCLLGQGKPSCAGGGIIYDLLLPDLSGDIETCLMEIPAQSATCIVPKSHVGEKVDYVVSEKATTCLK